MTWLYIIIAIIVVIFIISLLSGESTGDAAANAAGAGMWAGGCMLQIFFSVIGILIMIWIFGFLFS
jgi:hypothetical protein